MPENGDLLAQLKNELERARRQIAELQSFESIQHTAARLLRESEQRYFRLFDNAPVAFFRINLQGEILDANIAFVELLGFPDHRTLLATNLRQLHLVPPTFDTLLRELYIAGSIWDRPLELRHWNGDPVRVHARMFYVKENAGRLEYIEGSYLPRWQEDLQRETERARMLSSRVMEAQEEERRRIARELHDEIGQSMTALKLALQSVTPTPETASHLTIAIELAEQVLQQVRELSLDLRPAMLDDLGLIPALIWQFERLQKQAGLTVEFRRQGLDARPSPDVETAAYRIVQEALTNVVRHAGTRSAEVTIWEEDDTLMVRVTDHGCGFDVSAVQAAGQTRGLAGMRERAQNLGGECSILSTPGKGTTIEARFPLTPHGAQEKTQ